MPDSTHTHSTSPSRAAPPMVAPVVVDGIRYQQIDGATEPAAGQVGGVLGAFDVSGKLVWWLKVYDNPRRPEIEGDVQDVFFASLAVEPDGRLLIVNENGDRFAVDVHSRESTPLPRVAPPSGGGDMLPPPPE